MTISFDQNDPDFHVLAGMVERQLGSLPNLTVAGTDGRYASIAVKCSTKISGLMKYFRAGMQIHDAFRQVINWHFGSTAKISRILDFASGYGQSTRFLPNDFSLERVWTSDVSPEAREFQSHYLGVRTIPSTTKPESFQPGIKFDCIFVSSLFAGLPEESFTRWLWRLYSLLEQGGLLIFGIPVEETLPPGIEMPRNGYYFKEAEGVAIVADHFVQTAIHAVTGLADYQRVVRGLCFSNDLYLVAKGPIKRDPVSFQYGPNGYVDSCRWTDPEQMKLSGWAFDATAGEQVVRVEVEYNGTLRGTGEMNHFRPDVAASLGLIDRPEGLRSGWDCFVDLAGEKITPKKDWMLVRAISSSGVPFVLQLDHPTSINEFECLPGWTYNESEGGSQAIRGVVRYIDYPNNARFTSPDSMISGWIATENCQALHNIRLEGRFGAVPFTRTERPDVIADYPGFCAMGFHAVLPLKYLTVQYPRLRFITESGVALVTLDCQSESSAIEAVRALEVELSRDL